MQSHPCAGSYDIQVRRCFFVQLNLTYFLPELLRRIWIFALSFALSFQSPVFFESNLSIQLHLNFITHLFLIVYHFPPRLREHFKTWRLFLSRHLKYYAIFVLVISPWSLPFHTRVLVTVLENPPYTHTLPRFDHHPGSSVLYPWRFFEFLRRSRICISEFRIVICTIFSESSFSRK